MLKIFRKILVDILTGLIRLYQRAISPLLGKNCRFDPTCSEYSLQAFRKYGIIKGFYLSVKRIIRCHPWGGHGYDPLQ